MDPAALFSLIDALVRMRTHDIGALSSPLQGESRLLEDRSNAHFDVYEVLPRQPAIQRFEVRLPKEAGGPRVFLLDVDSGKVCASLADVLKQYGRSPELSVPTPRQPKDSPVYYVYRKEWGSLRLGINQTDCVTSVVLDIDR